MSDTPATAPPKRARATAPVAQAARKRGRVATLVKTSAPRVAEAKRSSPSPQEPPAEAAHAVATSAATATAAQTATASSSSDDDADSLVCTRPQYDKPVHVATAPCSDADINQFGDVVASVQALVKQYTPVPVQPRQEAQQACTTLAPRSSAIATWLESHADEDIATWGALCKRPWAAALGPEITRLARSCAEYAGTRVAHGTFITRTVSAIEALPLTRNAPMRSFLEWFTNPASGTGILSPVDLLRSALETGMVSFNVIGITFGDALFSPPGRTVGSPWIGRNALLAYDMHCARVSSALAPATDALDRARAAIDGRALTVAQDLSGALHRYSAAVVAAGAVDDVSPGTLARSSAIAFRTMSDTVDAATREVCDTLLQSLVVSGDTPISETPRSPVDVRHIPVRLLSVWRAVSLEATLDAIAMRADRAASSTSTAIGSGAVTAAAEEEDDDVPLPTQSQDQPTPAVATTADAGTAEHVPPITDITAETAKMTAAYSTVRTTMTTIRGRVLYLLLRQAWEVVSKDAIAYLRNARDGSLAVRAEVDEALDAARHASEHALQRSNLLAHSAADAASKEANRVTVKQLGDALRVLATQCHPLVLPRGVAGELRDMMQPTQFERETVTRTWAALREAATALTQQAGAITFTHVDATRLTHLSRALEFAAGSEAANAADAFARRCVERCVRAARTA